MFGRERCSDKCGDVVEIARARGSEEGFQFREGLLDRIEVGAVGRQKSESAPRRLRWPRAPTGCVWDGENRDSFHRSTNGTTDDFALVRENDWSFSGIMAVHRPVSNGHRNERTRGFEPPRWRRIILTSRLLVFRLPGPLIDGLSVMEGVLHDGERADVLNRVGSQNREVRSEPGAIRPDCSDERLPRALGPVETSGTPVANDYQGEEMAVLLAYLKVPLTWGDVFKRTFKEAFWEDNCLGMAAQLAYYFFFALFPALLFVLAVASYFPVEALIDDVFRNLGGFVPPEALSIISDQLTKRARNFVQRQFECTMKFLCQQLKTITGG